MSCAIRPGEEEVAGSNKLMKEFCLTVFKEQPLASPKFAYNCQNNLIFSLFFLGGGEMKKKGHINGNHQTGPPRSQHFGVLLILKGEVTFQLC